MGDVLRCRAQEMKIASKTNDSGIQVPVNSQLVRFGGDRNKWKRRGRAVATGMIRSLSRDEGGMLRLEDINTRSSTGELPLVVRLWYDRLEDV